MRSTLKFLIVLAVSLLVMLVFRALAFTVYAVGGKALEPDFKAGDRVLVNRWSYGLRTGAAGSSTTAASVGRCLPSATSSPSRTPRVA